MNTINPYSLTNTVNSLSFTFQSPIEQFNLNSNHDNSNNTQNIDLNNLNSNLETNLNNSLNNSLNNNMSNNSDNSDNSLSSSNSFNLNTNTLNSNLNQLIRDELNDVNLCSRTNSGKKENFISINKFLNQRSYGHRTPYLSPVYGLHHLISNNLLKEDVINLGQVDKIYSSCFIDDDFVICGTKCNKLILINLNNKKHHYLPVAQSRTESVKSSSGIYSITINPSHTLLASGTKNGNDIAIYRLPTLDILYLLEGGHEDSIFDIVWLDDHFLASGSKDSSIVIWKIDDNECEIDSETNLYKIKIVNPIEKFTYKEIDQIRCLNFNRRNNEFCVLSLVSNLKLHLIDALTMTRKISTNLVYYTDLCCLAQNEDNLYAVGSKNHIQLIDSRSLTNVSTIGSKINECGIRSLSFNSEILSIGSGGGNVLFYDIRNSKYFCNKFNQDLITLKTSKGWNKPTNQINQNYGNPVQQDLPAIYTHQYDKIKCRLFLGGGPLTTLNVGNYCGIWS